MDSLDRDAFGHAVLVPTGLAVADVANGEGFIFFLQRGSFFFYRGSFFFYTKNYVKTKSYRCAYMGRPPLVVRQMRGMKRKAAKGAGLCCSTGLES